jgi:hypothetical protein
LSCQQQSDTQRGEFTSHSSDHRARRLRLSELMLGAGNGKSATDPCDAKLFSGPVNVALRDPCGWLERGLGRSRPGPEIA